MIEGNSWDKIIACICIYLFVKVNFPIVSMYSYKFLKWSNIKFTYGILTGGKQTQLYIYGCPSKIGETE